MSNWREKLAEHEKIYEDLDPSLSKARSIEATPGNAISVRNLSRMNIENYSPRNMSDHNFKPDHYTLNTVREAITLLNGLEEQLSSYVHEASQHRSELLTQSNQISRLLSYKQGTKIKLHERFGEFVTDIADNFDLTKTPIAGYLRKIQSSSFALRRDLETFIASTVTSSLETVGKKLAQLQDRIISLREQEAKDKETNRQRNQIVSGLDDSDEENETLKGMQLERHQRQLDMVNRRKNSISRRAKELLKDIDLTSQNVDAVGAKTEIGEKQDVPTNSLCILDTLKPSWLEMSKLQERKVTNNRCKNYLALVTMRQLPVCDQFYEFLFNPSEFANVLAFSNYSFAPGELATILSFVSMSTSVQTKVYHLSFYDCGIEDGDCRVIAASLIGLPNIHTLTIRKNNITSSGAMVLFTRIWESHAALKLNFIHLDGNEIGEEGALSISQALPYIASLKTLSISDNPISDSGAYHILRCLVNPKRKAHTNFPMPDTLHFEENAEQERENYLFQRNDSDSDSAGGTSDLDIRSGMGNEERDLSSKNTEDLPNSTADDNDASSHSEEEMFDDLSHASSISPEVPSERMRMTFFQRRYVIRLKLLAVGMFINLGSKGPRVCSLDISNCALTSFSAHMLSVVIAESHLTEVYYSDNEISRAGANDIAAAMSKSQSLRELVLQNTDLSDFSIKLLVRAAQSCGTLLKLDLSRNTIGPAGANWITSMLNDFYIDTITFTAAAIDKKSSYTSTDRAEAEEKLLQQGNGDEIVADKPDLNVKMSKVAISTKEEIEEAMMHDGYDAL